VTPHLLSPLSEPSLRPLLAKDEPPQQISAERRGNLNGGLNRGDLIAHQWDTEHFQENA